MSLCLAEVFLLTPGFAEQKPARSLTPQAQEMYEKYHKAIVQIRVISRASSEKSSLGSGFFFGSEKLIATNYHVVSDAVNYPGLYFMEYIAADGQKGEVEILNIDPVHDLAIVRVRNALDTVLELGDRELKKGEKIFSFGNPYDLGLIIVEGLFNGLMENSRYPKILYSGSINPGMSGGPAVDERGHVIGVNVSTAGDEISFFVPVVYLSKMVEELEHNHGRPLAKGSDWKSLISRRLIDEEEEFAGGLLSLPNWSKRALGPAEVPGEISPAFRCWGESGDNKRYWVVGNYLTCSTEDEIFISDTLTTGKIFFEYTWYTARDQDPIRFYKVYETYAKYSRMDYKNAAERDVSKFECRQDIVQLGQHSVFVNFCARKYKMYPHLYDVTVNIAQVDAMTQGLSMNVGVMGVTEALSQRLFERFLKEIEWHASY